MSTPLSQGVKRRSNESPVWNKPFAARVPAFPPVNITEKESAYSLELAAPGMEKQDFTVNLENDLLTISAEKKEETASESEKNIRREFRYQSFKRSFTLDEKIDATAITAKYENGILKLELPKKKEEKASTQTITIA